MARVISTNSGALGDLLSRLVGQRRSQRDLRVVISSDSAPLYLFFLPLTGLVWLRRMPCYGVTALLVGDDDTWERDPLARLAAEYACELGINVQIVPPIPGFKDGNVAQVARLFAAALPLHEGSYLLTSDVDMWPISSKWFVQQEWNYDAHLFYANAYDHTRYPMCYVGMPASTWREVMGINGANLWETVRQEMMTEIGPFPDSEAVWNLDEQLLHQRLTRWEGYPQRCQMIERTPVPLRDRLDRNDWAGSRRIRHVVDAHLLRPGYTEENWTRLAPLLRQLIPPRDFARAIAYQREFLERLAANAPVHAEAPASP